MQFQNLNFSWIVKSEKKSSKMKKQKKKIVANFWVDKRHPITPGIIRGV